MNNIEVHAQSSPWWKGVEICIMSLERGHYYVAKPVVMEEADLCSIVEPTLKISIDAAQTLMDDLWNCGIRPTNGAGSVGQLQATERHLEDMRRIALKRLGLGEEG